ncbi:GMC family oxidoreductase [Paraglaciecola agarilytica]|uniref:GMC family oxidoreductase n=1 Tax=Paraglaciecola chathamensis TaxID=368405 RepID=UPI001C0977F4|nr:GMC family oxidoreductase [Paraglaciecola agarilytica]MBU3019892.1 GMC family oxidoreductase [Paraglaciecola agarilytica]
MTGKFNLNDSSVVVIIGSGAGGGTLANELAQKGIRSVVLEAGKRFTFGDIENDEWKMFSKVSWLDKRVSSGGWHLTKNHKSLPAWIVKGVGGSTVHWAGVALRYKEHEFKTQTINGQIAGANVLDWPISLSELAPYYDKAELKMGVTGNVTGMPHLPWNNDFKVMAEGAKRVGYKDIVSGPMAINSQARDGRPGCQQIGFCMQGCKIGAKWSTMYTEIPRAEATGHCEVRPGAMVQRIEHDKKGRATGVVYVDEQGNTQIQKARIVCVAGNSIESPRLLLNSESNMFKDGLANSSGQVGKNYMVHNTAGVYAVMPEEVNMHRGTTCAGIVGDERRDDPSRGFVGGYTIETLSLGLPFMSAFMDPNPSGWGRGFASTIEKYNHMSGVWIVGEDLAMEENNIFLHPTEKDQYGLPVPIVSKSAHSNDVVMHKHALATMEKIYKAVGAEQIVNLPQYPASHNMGTNRMSEKARDGVVNRWGQSHDIDNLFISDGSQFTSSGSPNPTLTIVALAIRQADYIAEQMLKKEI